MTDLPKCKDPQSEFTLDGVVYHRSDCPTCDGTMLDKPAIKRDVALAERVRKADQHDRSSIKIKAGPDDFFICVSDIEPIGEGM